MFFEEPRAPRADDDDARWVFRISSRFTPLALFIWRRYDARLAAHDAFSATFMIRWSVDSWLCATGLVHDDSILAYIRLICIAQYA